MISDTLLRRYVAGVLEPSEAALVADWIDAEEGLAQKALLLAREFSSPSPWVLPFAGAPGVGALGTDLRVSFEPQMVMGSPGDAAEWPTVELGTSLQLAISQDISSALHVVCMRRVESQGWEVVFPTRLEERVSLVRFPLEDGHYRIRVVLGEPAGLQEWAVWLIEPAVEIDFEMPQEERWAPLFDGLFSETASCCTTAVEVVEPGGG